MEIAQNTCEKCGTNKQSVDRYCSQCGALFIEETTCYNHPSTFAQGVCAICNQACCKKCGLWVNHIFLCDLHSNYDIYEGMACVGVSDDEMELKVAHDILVQEGFHPFIYKTMEYRNRGLIEHSLVPVKLLVPCKEVFGAEKVIDDFIDSVPE